jgi:hypothetical protein
MDLVAADTRVFLFHSPNASSDAGGAMDKVNAWLAKDRSDSQYPNLRIKDITVIPDGGSGVFTLVTCSLGKQDGI